MIKLFLLFLLTFKSVLAQEVLEKEIPLVIGINQLEYLTFDPYQEIDYDKSLLKIVLWPQKRELTFEGKKQGTNLVYVRDTQGNVRAKFTVVITETSNSKTVLDLRDFLGDIEGLEIGIKGGKVYVGGQIIVPTDIGRISTILSKYPDVINLVELSPHSQKIIAKKMQEAIQNAGMKEVTVNIVNQSFWLEGLVASENEKNLAYKIAAYYLPDKLGKPGQLASAEKKPLDSFIQISEKKQQQQQQQQAPEEKMLKVIAQFVELSKDYNKLFGFKWTPILDTGGGSISFGKTAASGVATSSTGTLSGVISNLFPKLESAKAAGHARVVQSGMVIFKDKGKGSLSKKSKIPYGVGTGENIKPAEASSGFTLNIGGEIKDKEDVQLDINISVNINTGTKQDGTPLTTDNSLQTVVKVKSKDTAAIGGVVFNEDQVAYDKNPAGGQVSGSPLFNFIRSKSFVKNKSQYVVFVTPEIVESASDKTDEIKMKFRRRSH
ncbi:MAG: hypothetical protein U0T83_00100 [Bacteriovoracaceae bacterium]